MSNRNDAARRALKGVRAAIDEMAPFGSELDDDQINGAIVDEETDARHALYNAEMQLVKLLRNRGASLS